MQVTRAAAMKQLKSQHLMIKAFALTILLLLVARPLHAADWKEFRGKALQGTTVFVDGNSVEVDRDIVVKGWVKFEYAKPKRSNGAEVTSRVTYRMANCESRRYWVVEDLLNAKNSIDPIRLEAMGFAQQWQVPAPGTESEMALEALCYETRSMFGSLWDTVEETYEAPKATEVGAISAQELSDLGVEPAAGDTQIKAWVGTTSVDSKTVNLRSNHVILGKDAIHFIGWDKTLQQFKKDSSLPLSQISSAVLVNGGSYEQLRQIHLIAGTEKTVISFSLGENAQAESTFAKFGKAGLNTATSSRYVHGYREDTVIIPPSEAKE